MQAEAPPGGGTIISVEWDFDNSGAFPVQEKVDGTETAVDITRSHSYDAPGTYFASVRVCSNREGDVSALFRRLPNVASVRVVVT
jgi:hypothetical protein